MPNHGVFLGNEEVKPNRKISRHLSDFSRAAACSRSPRPTEVKPHEMVQALFPFIFLTALVVGAVFLFQQIPAHRRSDRNPVPTVEEIRLEDFAYSPDDGYTFLPAPFGTPEEKMRELFGYTTSENTTAYGSPTFDLLGLPAKYNATFAYKENSPMHAISFSVSSGGEADCTAEEVEAGYAEVLAYFESAFGPADETERGKILQEIGYTTPGGPRMDPIT